MLLTAPVLAQPPGTQPGTAPPRPIPGFAQPNGLTKPVNLTGDRSGTGQDQAGASNTLPNGLALPPGYRPRTPPPQPAQPSQPIRPVSATGSGSGETMMYFQKPADALTATGGGLPASADGVAAAPPRDTAALPVPDTAPVRTLPAPAPAPFAAPTGFAQPDPQPPLLKTQPEVTSTSEKKQDFKIKDVDPKEIQLPAREKIFGVAYNDPQLERAVMDAVIQDRIRVLERQLRDETDRKLDTRATERALQELRAIKDPLKLSEYQFPALPVVSPPGVPYQPKTLTYAPNKMLLEPGYVVHRRLFGEQRNFERAGWDLGPLTTLVSAGTFYRDVLLWPAMLASGRDYGFWDTSAGKCLPGSPTPLYLYPPNLTCGGVLAEAGIITGFSFLFP